MDRRGIQRLAAAQLDPTLYRELAEHGEDLLVERKRQITQPERFGPVVSSMANMLGGWILLGVDDKTRKLHALDLKKGTDLQSHLGDVLRRAVDPVPPFLAGMVTVDDLEVGFVKVFAASVPVIVRGTGAIYSRDDGGKLPVSDHRVLLELARRGAEAEEAARTRPNNNDLSLRLLGLKRSRGSLPEFHMETIVRAAPLTVTPQLAEWPISAGGAGCHSVAFELGERIEMPQDFAVTVRPYGRAAAAFATAAHPPPFPQERAVAVADCAGVFAAASSRTVVNVVKTDDLRRRHIRPPLDAVADLLDLAEARGEAVVDLILRHNRKQVDLVDEQDGSHRAVAPTVHCGSAVLTTPADEADRAELASRWEREVARTAGISAWEGRSSDG